MAKKEKTDSQKKVNAFVAKINKECGANAAGTAAKRVIDLRRISTGSFDYDLSLGGGIPRARVTLIYGPASAGKSTICTKLCESVEKYCKGCGEFQDNCKCSSFEPQIAFFIDAEGTFDRVHATKLGFNDEHHILYSPECGEEAVQLVTDSIREEVFDIIIIDSLEALCPREELEKTAENAVVGKKAIMLNRAFRTWSSALIASKGKGPAIVCINQMREAVGKMFGDPTVLPGGKGQHFAASIKTRLKTCDVKGVTGMATNAYVQINGWNDKNKTYVPREEFSFQMALQDYGIWKAGEINNIDPIIMHGKNAGVILRENSKWKIPSHKIEVKIKDELVELLHQNPDILKDLWEILMEELLK